MAHPRYSIREAIEAALGLGQRALEEVRALAARPSIPGKDGLGFDDLTFHHDGERGFAFRLVRGDQVKEFPFSIPVVIDRGVWKQSAYRKGDGVTFRGSWFIAQCDTEDQPETSSDWRLAVKRGRDGKDAKGAA